MVIDSVAHAAKPQVNPLVTVVSLASLVPKLNTQETAYSYDLIPAEFHLNEIR